MAMAHSATEVMRSPIITNLTIQSACWNRSHIESGAPADGMASPSGVHFFRPPAPAILGSTTGVMGHRRYETGMPSGIALRRRRPEIARKAGPHRYRYRYPAKGDQTRAQDSRPEG